MLYNPAPDKYSPPDSIQSVRFSEPLEKNRPTRHPTNTQKAQTRELKPRKKHLLKTSKRDDFDEWGRQLRADAAKLRTGETNIEIMCCCGITQGNGTAERKLMKKKLVVHDDEPF